MLTVLCGLIYNAQHQLFIARRAPHKVRAGFWEFPGGKLEPGEPHDACLKRELLEELGMHVEVQDHIETVTHQYPDLHIQLIAYKCQLISASYQRTDHDAYAWVYPEQLGDYNLSEADREIVKRGS